MTVFGAITSPTRTGAVTGLDIEVAGASAEINLASVMMLRARIFGSTLRARPLEAKADAARRVESQVVPLLAARRLRVPIVARFTLAQVTDAYDRFATPGKMGKVILVMK